MNLAVMVELPVVIVDVQRAGPSTGMPTKTEQGDLLMAMFGRNGESPVPIVAPATPAECFDLRHRGGAARAQVHDAGDLPVRRLPGQRRRAVAHPVSSPSCPTSPSPTPPTARRSSPTRATRTRSPGRGPYPARPASSTASAGSRRPTSRATSATTPRTTNEMTLLRAQKVAGIADDIPPLEVFGPAAGDLLILGWGSTYGAIRSAVERLQAEGWSVAHAHLRHLNPLPAQHRGGAAQLPPGAGARGQPGPARRCCCARAT